MTQVKEMTDIQLNFSLYQLMPGEKVDYAEQIPDYCTDPAASLEVQAAGIALDKSKYFATLMKVKNLLLTSNTITWCEAVALAAPRERAEAAYIILNCKGDTSDVD